MQHCSALFLSWMPFRQTVWWAEGFVGKHILTKVQFNSNKCIYFKISSFLCQRKEKWQILFWKCFDMKYFNFYVQSLRGEKSVFQSCNAIFVNKFHYFAVECLKWRPRGIKSLHSGFRGTMYFTKLKSQHNPSHSTKSIYYCSLLFRQNNWVDFT